jgi:hypothetical protein
MVRWRPFEAIGPDPYEKLLVGDALQKGTV